MGGMYRTPKPPEPPITRPLPTTEQREAFIECLKKLFDEFPSTNERVLAKRASILVDVKDGYFWIAGHEFFEIRVPRERIEAIEALLF